MANSRGTTLNASHTSKFLKLVNVKKNFFNIFMIIFRNGFMYKTIAFCEIWSINCQSSSSKREIVQMDTLGCSLSIFWVSGMK